MNGEITKCIKCKREFEILFLAIDSNLQDKRQYFIHCPHCGSLVKIVTLFANEYIEIKKI